VRLAGGKIGVTDGPFPGAKKVIGGNAFLECSDKEPALQGCAEFLDVHCQHWPGWEGEIEMRRSSMKTTALAPTKSRARRTGPKPGPPSTRDAILATPPTDEIQFR